MAAKRIDDLLYLLAALTLRRRLANPDAPYTQRLARTWQFHALITAKRRHGPVNAGEPVLCSADCEGTTPNHVAQIRRIVGQHLPINQPRIIDPGPLFGAAPFHECLPPITVCLHRAVVAAAEHVFQRLRTCVARLPALAEIAAIAFTHQCHIGHLIAWSPILGPTPSRQEC